MRPDANGACVAVPVFERIARWNGCPGDCHIQSAIDMDAQPTATHERPLTGSDFGSWADRSWPEAGSHERPIRAWSINATNNAGSGLHGWAGRIPFDFGTQSGRHHLARARYFTVRLISVF